MGAMIPAPILCCAEADEIICWVLELLDHLPRSSQILHN